MHYLLIPISNLVLGKIIKLAEVIIFPCYCENFDKINFDFDIQEEEINTVKILVSLNKTLINSCGDIGINLAILKIETDISSIDNIDIFIETKIHIVNQLLDYIRINYCNFNNRETLIGTPGLINNSKEIFYCDHSLKYVKAIKGKSFFYSMQPGIGLDISTIDSYWKCNQLHSALTSHRDDEVYLEFHTILGRACNAMHIMDINRCFCYLFSTVERMGSQKFCKFEIRKKRIISFISKNQEEFNLLSNQFYFYSKTVRTEIIHKGKNILDIIPINKTNEIINSLFLLIVRFSLKVINSDIHNFDTLDNTLQTSFQQYEYQTPNLPTVNYTIESFLDDNEFTFIAPINNLSLNKILKLGNALFIPQNSAKNLDKYAWVYAFFEQGLTLEDFDSISTPNNTIIELDEFKNLCAEDILAVQSALCSREIYELNQKCSIATIFN